MKNAIAMFAVMALSLALVAGCARGRVSDTDTSQAAAAPTETPEEAAMPADDLTPHLLRVMPEAGAVVGLDLRLCARFDVTSSGLGGGWSREVWYEIAGVQTEGMVNTVNHRTRPTERSGCSPTLRHLLREGEAASPPSPGPVEVAVRYRDTDGVEHRYAWQAVFSIEAPGSPAEVQRIRAVYGPLQEIDRGKGSRDLTIAGYYLEGDVVSIYLYDNADSETVRAEAEAALGDAMPSGGMHIHRLESPPDPAQFEAWVDEAAPPVWAAEDISLQSASGGCCNIWNRVRFSVGTLYSAHLVRKAIAGASVPQEAVAVSVSPQPSIKEPAPGPNGLISSVEFDSTAIHGEALSMDVVWTNEGQEDVYLEYNPYLPYNLIVFTAEGDRVWASFSGGPVPLPAQGKTLTPEEEITFTVYWELTDQDGFAVPPGDYLVQAQSNIRTEAVHGEEASVDLISEAHPLRIDP